MYGDPSALTGDQLAAWLDTNPCAEARALLRSGRLLKAEEVVFLCLVCKVDRPSRQLQVVFSLVRDRIMHRREGEGSHVRRGCHPGSDTPGTLTALSGLGSLPPHLSSFLAPALDGPDDGRPGPRILAASGPLTILPEM